MPESGLSLGTESADTLILDFLENVARLWNTINLRRRNNKKSKVFEQVGNLMKKIVKQDVWVRDVLTLCY